jgi:hypothetical protein
MSSSNLIRLGGLATMVAGTLLIIVSIALIMGAVNVANRTEEATTGTYAVLTSLFALATILLQGGLVAMYAHRLEAMGIFGLVGFLVAFFGTALMVGYSWAEAYVVPAVADIDPVQLNNLYSIGTWGRARVAALLLYPIGWMVFGFAAYQARVYPAWAARVLVIGAIINLSPRQGTDLVFAVGLVWVGFVVFARRATSDQQPSRVT